MYIHRIHACIYDYIYIHIHIRIELNISLACYFGISHLGHFEFSMASNDWLHPFLGPRMFESCWWLVLCTTLHVHRVSRGFPDMNYFPWDLKCGDGHADVSSNRDIPKQYTGIPDGSMPVPFMEVLRFKVDTVRVARWFFLTRVGNEAINHEKKHVATKDNKGAFFFFRIRSCFSWFFPIFKVVVWSCRFKGALAIEELQRGWNHCQIPWPCCVSTFIATESCPGMIGSEGSNGCHVMGGYEPYASCVSQSNLSEFPAMFDKSGQKWWL